MEVVAANYEGPLTVTVALRKMPHLTISAPREAVVGKFESWISETVKY